MVWYFDESRVRATVKPAQPDPRMTTRSRSEYVLISFLVSYGHGYLSFRSLVHTASTLVQLFHCNQSPLSQTLSIHQSTANPT